MPGFTMRWEGCGFGPVVDGLMELWDSQTVPVSDLLGGDTGYDDGDFVVIYLAPPDYHRVHSPVDGAVTGFSYLPGHLWPVFPAAVRAVKNLFSKTSDFRYGWSRRLPGRCGW